MLFIPVLWEKVLCRLFVSSLFILLYCSFLQPLISYLYNDLIYFYYIHILALQPLQGHGFVIMYFIIVIKYK